MGGAEEIRLLSEEEYLAAEEAAEFKSEYVAGMVYGMAGALVKHNRVVSNALGQLYSHLRGKLCEPFGSDMKVRLESRNDLRFHYPDVVVDCGSAEEDSVFLTAPKVIVEVLSPNTRRIDLSEKLEAYLSIPELGVYLIIEPSEPFVRECRPAENSEPATKEYRDIDDVIALPEIEAELLLRDLYEGIDH